MPGPGKKPRRSCPEARRRAPERGIPRVNSRVTTAQTHSPPALQNGPTGPPEAVKHDGHLLSTTKLVKEYRQRRVVNGVSMHVDAGEIVGLLGPNGAGKTTTFNMVVGL